MYPSPSSLDHCLPRYLCEYSIQKSSRQIKVDTARLIRCVNIHVSVPSQGRSDLGLCTLGEAQSVAIENIVDI